MQSPQPAKTSGLAVTSFVLGLLSCTALGFLSGIPAIICGHHGRAKIRAASGTIGGAGLALSGLILGYVGTFFTSIVLVWAFLVYNVLPENLEIARAARVRADLAALATQLMIYHALDGSHPTTEQGLHALVVRPTNPPIPRDWRQLMPSVPLDPWGSEYGYRAPGSHTESDFDLFSAGPDRQTGTADDIYRSK